MIDESQRLLRIFVVDDEDVIASSLATILQFQDGFHAKSFSDPMEALEAAQHETPDLLISDVVMPRLSGIELAIQMQQACPACKVLLFSGISTTVSQVDEARAKGHKFEFLAKPVHPATLLWKIQDLTDDAALSDA